MGDLDRSSFLWHIADFRYQLNSRMHHPDIYDILSIVEDYFLLSDSEFKCKIEPIIYTKPYNRDNPDEDVRERKGLKIIRQLNQGRIEINIFGIGKDHDCMDFQYFTDEQPIQPIETIDTSSMGYHIESARAAIRKIVILDRDRITSSESS
jgi:hypothetical protein